MLDARACRAQLGAIELAASKEENVKKFGAAIMSGAVIYAMGVVASAMLLIDPGTCHANTGSWSGNPNDTPTVSCSGSCTNKDTIDERKCTQGPPLVTGGGGAPVVTTVFCSCEGATMNGAKCDLRMQKVEPNPGGRLWKMVCHKLQCPKPCSEDELDIPAPGAVIHFKCSCPGGK